MKTTISLDSDVRDRLAELARRHGRTLGEEIAALVEIADERDFWQGVSAGYADLTWATGPEVAIDDYPEFGHLSVGPIPAEGPHNEVPAAPGDAAAGKQAAGKQATGKGAAA